MDGPVGANGQKHRRDNGMRPIRAAPSLGCRAFPLRHSGCRARKSAAEQDQRTRSAPTRPPILKPAATTGNGQPPVIGNPRAGLGLTHWMSGGQAARCILIPHERQAAKTRTSDLLWLVARARLSVLAFWPRQSEQRIRTRADNEAKNETEWGRINEAQDISRRNDRRRSGSDETSGVVAQAAARSRSA